MGPRYSLALPGLPSRADQQHHRTEDLSPRSQKEWSALQRRHSYITAQFCNPPHRKRRGTTGGATIDGPCEVNATFSHRCNDLSERIDCAAGRVALAGTKLGPQWYRTDKGKQRQVTIAAIEAVKEPSFLMTVQRIISGIQVDDDLQAMLRQAAHPHQQKVTFDRLMVGADFMATSIFIVAELKSVQGRSAGQRILFTDSHGK